MSENPQIAAAIQVFRLCDHDSCCPEVRIGESEVTITDDFGGEVRITKAQFEQLQALKAK